MNSSLKHSSVLVTAAGSLVLYQCKVALSPAGVPAFAANGTFAACSPAQWGATRLSFRLATLAA
eukprot:2146901-Amphidinium_carterae.1